MKKLVIFSIIFAGFLLFSETQAQITTLYMRDGQTYSQYTTDVTLTNTTAQYFKIVSTQDWYTTQTVVLQLDSASGDHTNVAVQLQGRLSSQFSSWTNIGSAVNWAGTTSDTTLAISNTTENAYREFKILLTGTGTGTTTIDNFEFKQHYGNP